MRRTIQRLLTSFGPMKLLLRLAVRIFAPKNLVGVVGVILNDEGQVLLAEHVFRTRYRWGLPGGWVSRGEDPATALARELREELALEIEVGDVLLCRTEATVKRLFSPRSIGVAFMATTRGTPEVSSREILGTRWVPLESAGDELMPFQRDAVAIAG